MTPNKVEEIVVKLTRIAHPEDLGEPTSKLENAIRESLTQYHQDLMSEVVERIVPREKPMNVFSFVLRGEELEQYMRHKGWNECRDEIKQNFNTEA